MYWTYNLRQKYLTFEILKYLRPMSRNHQYRASINNCRVKPALEKILLCRLFEIDAQF
jgi:hypothetical protein